MTVNVSDHPIASAVASHFEIPFNRALAYVSGVVVGVTFLAMMMFDFFGRGPSVIVYLMLVWAATALAFGHSHRHPLLDVCFARGERAASSVFFPSYFMVSFVFTHDSRYLIAAVISASVSYLRLRRINTPRPDVVVEMVKRQESSPIKRGA
jgi:hypothetical protein